MENAMNGRLNDLVADLTCEDHLKCQKARRALVDIGAEAVPALIDALKHKHQWVRWEAAKALSEIGDPRSIEALVNVLMDQEFEIRWLAAEGLIRIGPESVPAILKQLVSNPESSALRLGAHRVFSDLPATKYRNILQPVMHDIELDESLHIPLHAKQALDAIKQAR